MATEKYEYPALRKYRTENLEREVKKKKKTGYSIASYLDGRLYSQRLIEFCAQPNINM